MDPVKRDICIEKLEYVLAEIKVENKTGECNNPLEAFNEESLRCQNCVKWPDCKSGLR